MRLSWFAVCMLCLASSWPAIAADGKNDNGWGAQHSALLGFMRQRPFSSQAYDELLQSLAIAEPVPANRGWIYYTAAYDLWSTGTGDPDLRIGYALRALELPLPVTEAVQANIIVGASIRAKHRDARGEELVEPRKQAAEAYLRAIRRAMDSDLPTTRPVLPEATWENTGVEDSHPSEREEIRRLQERVSLRAERLRLKSLASRWDDVHTRTQSAREAIISLYTKFPFRTEELRNAATLILHDDKAVADIVDSVERTRRMNPDAVS